MLLQLTWIVFFKLHGLPDSIVSDRDVVFISQFWQEFVQIARVQLKLSIVYHPQLNDQTKWIIDV